MKTFSEDFFAESNFIKSQIEFNYLDNQAPIEGEHDSNTLVNEGDICSSNNQIKNQDEVYHIAYNVNDGFIHIMGASVISVLENNKDKKFVVHIFTDGHSEENSQKIEELARKWHCHCILYTIDMKPFEDFHIKVARFSRITYARLYMPKVIKKQAKRFIYLDADTMCCGDFKELWHLDMNGAPMGAVSEHPEAVTYRAGHLKLKNGKYFNDGVMLIDIDAWEKEQITEKSFAYQNEPRERFLGQSQDVLNLVFDGTNYFLPAKYNAFGGAVNFNGEPVIAHWTGRRKPWQMVVTDIDAQWRYYNDLSPWESITNILPIKKPENYHDFQQWGRYEKSKGNYGKYMQGIFWYAVLRTIYKLGGNKKN